MLASIAAATTLGQQAHAQDVEGSRDHPLLSRIPGSVIRAYEHKEFDSFRLPLGPGTGTNEFADERTIEGETTWIAYRVPKERSTLEIFRSYRTALSGSGFEILWECETQRGCGNWFNGNYTFGLEPRLQSEAADEKRQRYLAAHRNGPDGEQWVALLTYPNYDHKFNIARLRIVEAEAMAEGLVTVDAATIAREIDQSGHIALYGIHFATNSAAIQGASRGALAEIATFLRNNPDIDVYVVGHTDNTGGFEHNMQLSRERAQAVVRSLTSDHETESHRLQPVGVGPVAPVTPNDTEDRRANNRRVEIVAR
ncbi:MAG: DUF4892 domain-containing protein [Gemmatimonadota bacterium]